MTRPELSGVRELRFSGWIRDNLPDSSTGLMVTDLDFILSNYIKKQVMLLEIKTRLAQLKPWQYKTLTNIDRWIRKGIDPDWYYAGFHIITFENTFFSDGKTFYDGQEITEELLIELLSI